jgi:hypothetical protein
MRRVRSSLDELLAGLWRSIQAGLFDLTGTTSEESVKRLQGRKRPVASPHSFEYSSR